MHICIEMLYLYIWTKSAWNGSLTLTTIWFDVNIPAYVSSIPTTTLHPHSVRALLSITTQKCCFWEIRICDTVASWFRSRWSAIDLNKHFRWEKFMLTTSSFRRKKTAPRKLEDPTLQKVFWTLVRNFFESWNNFMFLWVHMGQNSPGQRPA